MEACLMERNENRLPTSRGAHETVSFRLVTGDARSVGRLAFVMAGAGAAFSAIAGTAAGIGTLAHLGPALVSMVLDVSFAYFLYAAILLAAGRRPGEAWEPAAPLAAGLTMAGLAPHSPAAAVFVFGLLLGTGLPCGGESRTRLQHAASLALCTLTGSLLFGALAPAPGALSTAILAWRVVAGAVFGMIASLFAVPSMTAKGTDHVAEAYGRVRRELTGRLLDLCARCWAIYGRIRREAEPGLFPTPEDYREFRESLDGIILDTFALSLKWRDVEKYLARTDRKEIDGRLQEARKRLAAASDPVAGSQYARVAESLERRKSELDKLEQAKERVMSRLEYHLTVLEELQLSAIRLKSSTAQADTAASSALLDRLEDLSRDLATTSSALEEFEDEDWRVQARPTGLPS